MDEEELGCRDDYDAQLNDQEEAEKPCKRASKKAQGGRGGDGRSLCS